MFFASNGRDARSYFVGDSGVGSSVVDLCFLLKAVCWRKKRRNGNGGDGEVEVWNV